MNMSFIFFNVFNFFHEKTTKGRIHHQALKSILNQDKGPVLPPVYNSLIVFNDLTPSETISTSWCGLYTTVIIFQYFLHKDITKCKKEKQPSLSSCKLTLTNLNKL